MWGFYMAKTNTFREIENILKNLIKQLNETTTIDDTNLQFYNFFLNQNDSNQVIDAIKKTGFFRPSKYDFNIKLISIYLKETKEHKNFKKHSKYFSNIENLFSISKKEQYSFQEIKNFLLAEKSLVKYFLAKADETFYNYTQQNEIEFTLECLSFLIVLCKRYQITSGANTSKINIINKNDYKHLIELSEYIVNLKKIEIKIDFFEYQITKENSIYTLQNSSFEKNISMSYIRYNEQKYAIHHETFKDKKNEDTFDSLVKTLLKGLDVNFIAEIRNNPFPRICPKLNLNPKFIELLKTNYIYLEERSQLNFFFFDNFLEQKDINTIIYKNFNLLDIIKIQRLFKFISITYRVFFNKTKKKKNYENLLISSIIPVTSKNYLNDIFEKTLNTDKKNYMELIEALISTNFYKINDFLDIQYTPILSLGNEFLISPTILGNSNLIRSILINLNKNIAITSDSDKMIESLEKSFQNLNFSIATEVKLGSYEIDIIAKKGNEIFIFECKNSYHPVNEFELRNSFDHIGKASKQLENLKSKLNDTSTRKNLAQKIGFSLYKSNINYAIILSNRMFNGYVYNNYRCINSYTLNNLLNEGVVSINSAKYSLWKNHKFHESDLVDFINGSFISDYEHLAHENFIDYKIKNITLKLQRFGYSPEEIYEHIQKAYRKI